MSQRLEAAGVWDEYRAFIDRHEGAWELAMAGLAVVFVVSGFLADEPGASPVYGVVDAVLTAVFIAEFATRLVAAPGRGQYLRGHWIDAVAIIPTVRAVRVLRLLRLLRLVRAFAGVFRFVASLERLAMHRGLAWLVSAWLGVMVICSLALYAAENGVNAAIASPLDALWWGVVTLTTVGYGDVTPVTPEGRIAAAVLMLLDIGLFSAITATVTSFILGSSARPAGDRLTELADLRARGLLTDDEYAAKRGAVVDSL